MKKFSSIKWLIPFSLIFFQCGETPVIPGESILGFNALIDIVSEPPGENCTTGGSKILVGQDENKNGNLDATEVESISFVCNGSEGAPSASLLSLSLPESPGENCSQGGTRIEIGLDQNADGNLAQKEILSAFFVCNGGDGQNGGSGSDGNNGFISIIRATVEPSGSNCQNGGLSIEVGLDVNANANLELEEIQSTYFVCNGADGSNGFNTLSRVSTELDGSSCDNGGIQIALGLDSNRSGFLDDAEIASTNFLCNGNDGLDGSNGTSSLIRITPEDVGDNCSAGGLQIEMGLDTNADNSLGDEEVQYTYYICNGANSLNGNNGENGSDGFNTIISSSVEAADTNCTSGGLALTIGLDSNRNGSIDEGEQINTYFVCNGNDGADGRSVILVTAPAGEVCGNEGSTFTFGSDGNGDGDLADEADEVLEVMTICNGNDGSDGSNTIIVTTDEPAGENCITGGLAFTVGLDINSNNIIDTGEEVGLYYVCNGEDGASDQVFEFYFSEGLNGYTGVRDIAIADGTLLTEVGEVISVDMLSSDEGHIYHGLIYFPEIESIEQTVGTTQFEILESILYLRGASTIIETGRNDNYIGAKVLREDAPLFVEGECDWDNANNTETWTTPGAFVTENTGAFDFSDMFRLPQGIEFRGYIPLMLNRTEVHSWAQNADNNKGVVLSMVDGLESPYQLDIYSSNYEEDPNFRPVLYIKVQIISEGGRGTNGVDKNEWDNLTYEQKLAPLKKVINR